MGAMSSLGPPNATPYPGPYNTVPLQTNIRPNSPLVPNNEVYIPLQFDWTFLGQQLAPSGQLSLCYLANVGLAPGAIDYIRCLVIDNSYNDYDIHIQFLDGFTLTIPAWEPLDVYPVITTQKAFYVWCETIPITLTPIGTPITLRHLTTNIFVCNANIPPIRAKKLARQSIVGQAIIASGTVNFPVGNSVALLPGFGNQAVQGLVKQIIVTNNSTMGTGAAIGVTINIDGIFLAEFAFFQNPTPETNSATPIILSDLNIRASNVAFVVSVSGTATLNVGASVIFVDHAGFTSLT